MVKGRKSELGSMQCFKDSARIQQEHFDCIRLTNLSKPADSKLTGVHKFNIMGDFWVPKGPRGSRASSPEKIEQYGVHDEDPTGKDYSTTPRLPADKP